MESLFDTITKNLPKATDEQIQQLKDLEPVAVPNVTYDKMSLKELVAAWNKDPNEETTSAVLQKLKPTISSAMNSYAPGHAKDLAVKAATLTLQALKSYDPSRGTDPSTHVFNNLKRLNRYASRRQNIIPVSERASMESRMVQQARAEFMDTYDREPSDMELADETGFSVKKIQKILTGARVVSDTSTLNPENQASTIYAPDTTEDDYYDYVYRSVGPIDQKIMEWSSGHGGRKPLKIADIAAKLHITPAAVSQRRTKILNMMSEVRGLV